MARTTPTESKPKFVVFDEETLPKKRMRAVSHDLTILHSGMFFFGHDAYERLGRPERVALAQDPEDATNWFVVLTDKGFPIKVNNEKKTYAFNHVALAEKIKTSLQCPVKWNVRFSIKEADGVYTLLKTAVESPKTRSNG